MKLVNSKWKVTSLSILAVTAVLDLSGLSPWPLIFALLAFLTIFFAQRNGYVLALALSTVTLLAVGAFWYQIAPHIPGNLRLNTLLLEVLTSIILLLLASKNSRITFPTRTNFDYYIPAFIVPAFSALTIWILGVTKVLGYSWAMHNDAVWNLVVSRFVTGDGGIVPSLHANPSPLIPELLSFSSLSGRETQSASSLFEHDMTRAAEAWLLIALLSSLIAGLIALSIRTIEPLWLRIISGVGVSALPLAWFTLGYALEFGFYNATLALLLMLTTWLIWQKGHYLPYKRLSGLALALICCLAAWGPLALIPASLALLSLLSILFQKIKPDSILSLFFTVVSCLLAIIYGLMITLPDLRLQSGSLGADGGIFEITPTNAAITVGFCFIVLIFEALQFKDKNLLAGITVFTGASLLAVAYLAMQRGPDVSRWGYYPVKYSWFLMCSLIILVTADSLAWISSKKLTPWKSVLGTAIAGLLIFSVAWQMPVRVSPTYLSIFPLANIITHTGISGEDNYAARLFTIAEAGRPTIPYKGKDAFSDQFAARWLLQLESTSSEDKIRYWAYFLDTANKDQLCSALTDWDTQVTIITAEHGLADQLSLDCPDARFTVITE